MIRAFCTKAIEDPDAASITDEAAQTFVGWMFKANPGLYERLCRPFVEADPAASAAYVRRLSPADLRRYRRDACRLPLLYLDDDSGQIDFSALLYDRPGLVAPLCAAGVREGLAGDASMRRAFDEHQLDLIARRSCLRAIKAGAIDASGPRGFRGARFDPKLLGRAVRLEARRVAGV